MPRPKKHPDELRTERLSGVRLTPAERQHVEATAAAAGVDLTEFCRLAILGQRIAAKRSRPVDRALAELNRAGVNLNQIARAVNEGRGLPRDFPEVLAELRAAIEKVAADGP